MQIRHLFQAAVLSSVAILATGCVSPSGSTPSEEVADIRTMRDDTLREAYEKWPDLEAKIKASPGYVVFRTGVIKILLIGTVNSYGVIVDNRTGKETYLKNFAIALGPMIELGIQRAVMVIEDTAEMDDLSKGGWNFGADAAIGLRLFGVGGGASATAIDPGVDVYRKLDTGVALGGTLFWARIKQKDEWNAATPPKAKR
jgi:hypothetical protein